MTKAHGTASPPEGGSKIPQRMAARRSHTRAPRLEQLSWRSASPDSFQFCLFDLFAKFFAAKSCIDLLLAIIAVASDRWRKIDFSQVR
jgi:hypothetical protein